MAEIAPEHAKIDANPTTLPVARGNRLAKFGDPCGRPEPPALPSLSEPAAGDGYGRPLQGTAPNRRLPTALRGRHGVRSFFAAQVFADAGRQQRAAGY